MLAYIKICQLFMRPSNEDFAEACLELRQDNMLWKEISLLDVSDTVLGISTKQEMQLPDL